MAEFEDFDFDRLTESRPNRWRGRLVGLLGIGVLAAVGIAAVLLAADRDGGSSDAPPTTVPGTPTSAPADDDELEVGEVDAAGRYDGLDSVELPLEITPDTDLVDGQEVVARGTGFSPGATVGIAQCAQDSSGPAGIGGCDLSNYELGSVDAQGFVDMTLTVHRYIATEAGEIDCAQPTVSCFLGIGNINDYDESGTAWIWFDGNVEGARSPYLTLDRTDGLFDGDPIVVTGANFTPGETVRLSQCVIGGSYGFDGCFNSELVTDTVTVGDNGTFTHTVLARRHLAGYGIDCFDDPYGCRLAARGVTDAPNPIGLIFDGSVRPAEGVSMTVSPSFDLVDGTVVTIELAEVPSDGEVVAMQCVDQGANLGTTCHPGTSAQVVDGVATLTYEIWRTTENVQGNLVDCGEPGRVCELRIEGVHEQTVPLHFLGDE